MAAACRCSSARRHSVNAESRASPSCVDLTERKRAEAEARASERRYREVQLELAHANRVATMGQLSASIAHEVNQPIAAALTNAADRFALARRVSRQIWKRSRQALDHIVNDGKRAADVIGRIRDLSRRRRRGRNRVEINEAILEVIALTRERSR